MTSDNTNQAISEINKITIIYNATVERIQILAAYTEFTLVHDSCELIFDKDIQETFDKIETFYNRIDSDGNDQDNTYHLSQINSYESKCRHLIPLFKHKCRQIEKEFKNCIENLGANVFKNKLDQLTRIKKETENNLDLAQERYANYKEFIYSIVQRNHSFVETDIYKDKEVDKYLSLIHKQTDKIRNVRVEFVKQFPNSSSLDITKCLWFLKDFNYDKEYRLNAFNLHSFDYVVWRSTNAIEDYFGDITDRKNLRREDMNMDAFLKFPKSASSSRVRRKQIL